MATRTVEAPNRNAADSIIYQCYSRARRPRKPAVRRDRQTAAPEWFNFDQSMGRKSRRLEKFMLRFDR